MFLMVTDMLLTMVIPVQAGLPCPARIQALPALHNSLGPCVSGPAPPARAAPSGWPAGCLTVT